MNLFKFLSPAKQENQEYSKKQYDFIGEQYSKHIDGQKLNSLFERPYILSQLPPLQGLKLLDAGCGSGFFSKYAAERDAHVIAVDISQKMIEKTRKVTKLNIEAHVADLSESLDFIQDVSVDVIICSLTLHYLEDWTSAFREFHRILKSNGVCLVSVHHPLFSVHFNREKYFEKRRVEDKWIGFGSYPLKVNYFIRPLQEYFFPFTLSWKSVSVEEPLPSQSLKETYPELFRTLSQRPVFLFYKLTK